MFANRFVKENPIIGFVILIALAVLFLVVNGCGDNPVDSNNGGNNNGNSSDTLIYSLDSLVCFANPHNTNSEQEGFIILPANKHLKLEYKYIASFNGINGSNATFNITDTMLVTQTFDTTYSFSVGMLSKEKTYLSNKYEARMLDFRIDVNNNTSDTMYVKLYSIKLFKY